MNLIVGLGHGGGLCAIAFASPTLPSSDVFQDCPACPHMKVVPAGAFEMGAAADDQLDANVEVPRHSIKIAKAFAVGIHEVTRELFKALIAATGHNAGNTCHGYGHGDVNGRKTAPDLARAGLHPRQTSSRRLYQLERPKSYT